jgi:hypothetical protein
VENDDYVSNLPTQLTTLTSLIVIKYLQKLAAASIMCCEEGLSVLRIYNSTNSSLDKVGCQVLLNSTIFPISIQMQIIRLEKRLVY